MADQKYPFYELLKFPIIALSVVLALIMAKWWLGLDLRMVKEIGTSGVKFRERQEATTEVLTELDIRLKEISERVAAIEKSAELTAPGLVTDETAQTTDGTARLAKVGFEGRETIFKGKEGFIWIGNYDSKKREWDRPKLLRIDSSQPVDFSPSSIGPGSKYAVAGNMALRGGLPKNDKEYFRGQPTIATVPRGTLVEILENPVGIDREFALQYWVKVRITE